jgi:hypothetical protein
MVMAADGTETWPLSVHAIEFAKENQKTIDGHPEYLRDIIGCKEFIEKLFTMRCHACSGMGHAAVDWGAGKQSAFGGNKKPCPT